jgi:hypothetical protein
MPQVDRYPVVDDQGNSYTVVVNEVMHPALDNPRGIRDYRLDSSGELFEPDSSTSPSKFVSRSNERAYRRV